MISIENTTITEVKPNGAVIGYRIEPNDGFVLHDKGYDFAVYDEYRQPTGETKRGYINAACICPVSYNFNVVTMIDGYTAHGNREFFARPISEVPADQIFRLDNEHEVMSETEETE